MEPLRTTVADLPSTAGQATPAATVADLRQMVGEFSTTTFTDAALIDLHEDAYRWLERHLNAYLLPHRIADYYGPDDSMPLHTSVWTPWRPELSESNFANVSFQYRNTDGDYQDYGEFTWDFSEPTPSVWTDERPQVHARTTLSIKLQYDYTPPAFSGPTGDELRQAAELLTRQMFDAKYRNPDMPMNTGRVKMLVSHLRRYGNNPFMA